MGKHRKPLQERIARLAELGVQGTLVESFLTCGTATCACHRDPERRHGPNLYLKFRNPESGRSTSIYVPRTHAKEAREAVAAWSELWEAIVELGQLNREALRKRVRRQRKGNARR